MNLFDIVCLGINGIVGAGIFLLPGQIAAQVGSFSILIFIICGLLCLAIALCFAEMGGIYQQTGGAYLYARDTFGPMIGFMVGWMVWLSAIIGWAAMARGFLLYLNYFCPSLSEGRMGEIIVIILIVGLSTLNFFGVKIGTRTINFFTISKLIPLFIFITLGFFYIKKSSLSPIFSFDIQNIGEAIVIALFAYTGFEHMPVPANSAPFANAILASSDNAPKLISETNRGIFSVSGLRAFGPRINSVAKGSSSNRGSVASWAVINWISSH